MKLKPAPDQYKVCISANLLSGYSFSVLRCCFRHWWWQWHFSWKTSLSGWQWWSFWHSFLVQNGSFDQGGLFHPALKRFSDLCKEKITDMLKQDQKVLWPDGVTGLPQLKICSYPAPFPKLLYTPLPICQISRDPLPILLIFSEIPLPLMVKFSYKVCWQEITTNFYSSV